MSRVDRSSARSVARVIVDKSSLLELEAQVEDGGDVLAEDGMVVLSRGNGEEATGLPIVPMEHLIMSVVVNSLMKKELDKRSVMLKRTRQEKSSM